MSQEKVKVTIYVYQCSADKQDFVESLRGDLTGQACSEHREGRLVLVESWEEQVTPQEFERLKKAGGL